MPVEPGFDVRLKARVRRVVNKQRLDQPLGLIAVLLSSQSQPIHSENSLFPIAILRRQCHVLFLRLLINILEETQTQIAFSFLSGGCSYSLIVKYLCTIPFCGV